MWRNTSGPGLYILQGHTPVEVEDPLEWARAFGASDRRLVHTWVGTVRISTVFLGLDHNFTDDGPPLLFETMILGGPHDSYCNRYATWEEALVGHREAVERATHPVLE